MRVVLVLGQLLGAPLRRVELLGAAVWTAAPVRTAGHDARGQGFYGSGRVEVVHVAAPRPGVSPDRLPGKDEVLE